MKTDTYTKIILTVITFLLIIIVLKQFKILPDYNNTPTEVEIFSQPLDVNIVKINGSQVSESSRISRNTATLPVRVEE
jgi:hypothetical protein